MSDYDIETALNRVCDRLRDARYITQERLDLAGDIQRMMLGDRRLVRADVVEAIRREEEQWEQEAG